jgi:hypothetical protein
LETLRERGVDEQRRALERQIHRLVCEALRDHAERPPVRDQP